jgi:hypothetical protein
LDEARKTLLGFGLDPELGRAADAHGRVPRHRLVEFCRARADHTLNLVEHGDVLREDTAGFVDVSRAERDDAIARLQPAPDFERDLLSVRLEDHGIVPVSLRFINDCLAGDPGNRRLARWIDIGDDDEIRIVE